MPRPQSAFPDELVARALRYCHISDTTFKATCLAKVFGCTKRTIHYKVVKVKKEMDITEPIKPEKLNSDEVFLGLLRYAHVAGFKLNPTIVGEVCGFTKRTAQTKLAHAREMHEAAVTYYANEEADDDEDDDNKDEVSESETTVLKVEKVTTVVPKKPRSLKPAAVKPKVKEAVPGTKDDTFESGTASVEGLLESSELKVETPTEMDVQVPTAGMRVRKPSPSPLKLDNIDRIPQYSPQWGQSEHASRSTSFSGEDSASPMFFGMDSALDPLDTDGLAPLNKGMSTAFTQYPEQEQWPHSAHSSCNTSFSSDDGLAPFIDPDIAPALPQIFPHDLQYPQWRPLLYYGQVGNYLPTPDSALHGRSQFPTFDVLYNEALSVGNNTYNQDLHDLAVGAAQHSPTWAHESAPSFALPPGFNGGYPGHIPAIHSLGDTQNYTTGIGTNVSMGVGTDMARDMDFAMHGGGATYLGTASPGMMNIGFGQRMPPDEFYYPSLMTEADTKPTQEQLDEYMNY